MLRRIVTHDNHLPPSVGPDGNPLLAVVTLRISPRPQDGEISLDKQEAETLAWCTAKGLTVAAIYVDDKISGRSRKRRTGLSAAIAHAKRIRAVLVGHSLSRFARSVKDMIAISEELAEDGLSFATATGPPVDTTTAMGRMVFNVLSTMNQYFAEYHAEQTREALRWRKEQGLAYSSCTPFGYQRIGPKGRRRIVPHEPAQQIVRWLVWRMRLGFSDSWLLRELWTRGYREWHQQRVLRRKVVRHIRAHPERHLAAPLVDTESNPPILDVSDLYVHRMAVGNHDALEKYTRRVWQKGSRQILAVPIGLLPDRNLRWPHFHSLESLVDRPVMDADGYLTVRPDTLRAIHMDFELHTHHHWPWPRTPLPATLYDLGAYNFAGWNGATA